MGSKEAESGNPETSIQVQVVYSGKDPSIDKFGTETGKRWQPKKRGVGLLSSISLCGQLDLNPNGKFWKSL